jgi:hypothetical protein
MLFSARSRGTVTIRTSDANEIPTVDHNYLADPLDLLVLSEGCHLGNEIMTKGEGTKDLLKGSWPRKSSHHTYKTREDWVPLVKDSAMGKDLRSVPSISDPNRGLAVVMVEDAEVADKIA